MTIVSLILYFLLEASSIKDYMDSAFLITLAILIFVSFSSSVLKSSELYAFIESCEKAANQSEFIEWINSIIYSKSWKKI